MNNVASVLSRLVARYHQSVISGGVECRLVIPGLTAEVVDELHRDLRTAGLPSLLVIPPSLHASESDAKLRPEGLTSLRHGDMIIVVWPGELSRIQDSIIGAGGTVRNFAFSDEWPWVDDGNEYFRFDGPFLQELLTAWNATPEDRKWLRPVILSVTRWTSGSIWRSRVVLEEILGGFSPLAYPELKTLREKFLYHCGIPRPGDADSAEQWDINDVLKQVEALSKVISNARLQVETRSDVLERVNEIEIDPSKQARFYSDVNGLLDGLARQAERHHVGVLTLRGCWGDRIDRWESLSLPQLRRLFDPTADISIAFNVRAAARSGVTSADEKKAVLFEGGLLEVTASYDGLRAEDTHVSRMVILQGARRLWEMQCTAPRDTANDLVPYEDIFGSASRKRSLRVQLRLRDQVVAEERLLVYPCGTNSPLVVVLQPGFEVYSAEPHGDDDEAAQRVEVATPVSVSVLTSDASREVSADFDGNPLEVVPDATDPRILSLSHFIDPGTEPAGRVSLTVACDALSVELDLEAAGYDRGEFTLEREFIVRLSEGSAGKVDRLIAVFTGTAKQPYNGLGGLTDLTRARNRYARAFEAPGSVGLPILADLLRPVPDAECERQGWVVVNRNANPGRLRHVTPGEQVQELLGKYQHSRRAVLDNVLQGMPAPEGRWPAYAWFPMFVEHRRGKIESALVEYLDTYSEILTFLTSSGSALVWEEGFLLSTLDCVVHWGDDSISARALLLGPWHPLVVAKRFMVQAMLLASARRFNAKQSFGFNRLAMLLDQLNAFRWIQVLSPDGSSFDNAYVSATSDPGWLLGISGHSVDQQTAEQLVVAIRQHLGLEAGVLPVAREQMASAYLRDFHNAYPSRRAIALSAAPLYSGQRIVESAASILYSGDEPSPSGRLLPGGLHLFLHDAMHIEPAPWRTPPICIYDVGATATWHEGHKDIHLLPPGKPRTSRVSGEEFPLARGHGDLAVLAAPVRRVSVGAHGIPNSFAFERDTTGRIGTSVGDAFVRALHVAGQLGGSPLCSSWSIELPENLKFLWNVIPGGQIDPAVLVEYVRQGYGSGQPRVLWDYSMSLAGASNSYFVLSQVPPSISGALNGSPVLAGRDAAKEIIRELAEIGLAVGSESMRSGSKALGVIGFVAAIRLFSDRVNGPCPLRNDEQARGFLLPVDSFRQILGEGMDSTEDRDGRRADLIACQLELDGASSLRLSFAAIECKYTANSLTDEDLGWALQQAGRTYDRLRRLSEAARALSGIPERLALLFLVSFGLRLRAAADDKSLRAEHEILRRLLNGEFEIVPPLTGTVVVATECQRQGASIVRRDGLIVRVAPGHWPGISESQELNEVRLQLALLFPSRERAAVDDTSPSDGPNEPETIVQPAAAANTVTTKDESVPPIPVPAQGTGVLRRLSPILLGTGRNRKGVFYDPQSERRPLDNYNMMITGSSGKGKTQLIKAVVAQLRRQDRNVVLLDFKNDFASDRVFLALSGLDCRYVTFDGLPYNPLIPMPVIHPGTGEAVLQISQHVSGIASVLGKTFGLGAQQESALKDVIRECFRERGLDPTRTARYDPAATFPDFNDVGEKMRAVSPLAYNRMDPLFDLGVFSSASRNTNFEAILRTSLVIDLSQIQSDTIKNAIAKILVLSTHAYYNARPHSGILRQFFVFDEAHRVLDTEFLVRFVRECRAYGVGILLSSQYPTDFPQEVSASLNTKILHGNGTERERVRDIVRMLGSTAEESTIAQMGLFEAFVSSPHYDATEIRSLAYPHYLVLSALRGSEGVRRHELEVEGVDRERLSIDFLLDALFEMGLAQDEGGVLRSREAG